MKRITNGGVFYKKLSETTVDGARRLVQERYGFDCANTIGVRVQDETVTFWPRCVGVQPGRDRVVTAWLEGQVPGLINDGVHRTTTVNSVAQFGVQPVVRCLAPASAR